MTTPTMKFVVEVTLLLATAPHCEYQDFIIRYFYARQHSDLQLVFTQYVYPPSFRNLCWIQFGPMMLQ